MKSWGEEVHIGAAYRKKDQEKTRRHAYEGTAVTGPWESVNLGPHRAEKGARVKGHLKKHYLLG